MDNQLNFKSTEKKVYRSTVADGLWDIFIGFFVLEFAVAPLLSSRLGDFWSSFIFLPIWLLVYLAIKAIRRKIIAPRIGTVNFGKPRKQKLKRFSLIMVIINLAIFLLGILAFLNFGSVSGAIFPGALGLLVMAGFSLAGFMLEYPRLYIYGSILLIAPLIGEWLYTYHGASHHGFPIVFGFTSGLMILIGTITFIRLLKEHPRIEIPESA